MFNLSGICAECQVNGIFEYLDEYIKRPNNAEILKSMGERDKRRPYSSRHTSFKSSQESISKKCEDFIWHFFSRIQGYDFENLYSTISVDQRINVKNFMENIFLDRYVVVACVKSESQEKFDEFLRQAFVHAENSILLHQQSLGNKKVSVLQDFSEKRKVVIDVNVNQSAQSSPHFSGIHDFFIREFVEEFDKTYQFYMCLHRDELIKRPDGADQLAKMFESVAMGALPSVNIGAAAVGLPLPISVSLPTGAVAVAVIELIMYMKRQKEASKVHRLGDFFEGWSLLERVQAFYSCAEFLARRFYDQIQQIEEHNIKFFAEMTVARIFRYAMASDYHIYTSAPGIIPTMLRKFFPNVPEPETKRRHFLEVALSAVFKCDHDLFMWEKTQTKPLNSLGWTAKGVFEHVGICTPMGECYKVASGLLGGQDVIKYGYCYSTEEEAKERGMVITKDTPVFYRYSNPTNTESFFKGSPSRSSALPPLKMMGAQIGSPTY